MSVKLTAPMFSLDASGSIADIKFIKNNFKSTFAVSKPLKRKLNNSFLKSSKRYSNLVDSCTGVSKFVVDGYQKRYTHYQLIKFLIDDMTTRDSFYSTTGVCVQ